jgi:capsular exopolysaccharide synthesis family protein
MMQPPAGGLSGADILRVVRQRLVLIIAIWILVMGATAGATFLMIKYRPSYTSMALIRVQSTSPTDPMNPMQREKYEETEMQRQLQDQALLVKSPAVLQKALEDSTLRGTTWFKEAQEKSQKGNADPRDYLDDAISAVPIRDSNYLGVTASWRIPGELPALINTVVQKYLDTVEQFQKENIRSNEASLSKELERVKKDLDRRQAELDAFRGREQVLGDAGKEISEKVLTLTALVTEMELDMLGKKAQYDNFKNARPENLPVSNELQNLLNADPLIAQLDQGLIQLDQSLSDALSRYGKNHRIVKDLQSQRDQIAERAMAERTQKLTKYQTEQIELAMRNYLETQDQMMSIKDRLTQAKEEQADRDSKYADYVRMLEERDAVKANYERLQTTSNELSMLGRQDRSVQIDVRSFAIPPTRRASPKWEIWMPAGAFLGLCMGVGLALLLEISDTSVRTPRDLARQSIPVLGTIPVTDDDEIEIARVETACLDAPHSITAEAFRNLRANLFFAVPPEHSGVMLVTSPSGGNGKTTIASNLAISIALSGRRVLLIDTNFRRPGLPRAFTGMRAEGLSNLLIGQGRLEDVVTTTAVPGLDVLSAGPIPPNPAELLGGGYLRELIAEGRTRYDQIIFDGPPFLLVSDAMVLAGAVDGVLVVCQYRATSRGALQRTKSQLDTINARIFGAVLNRVESRAGGYFRKNYREFYAYHEPGEEEETDQPKLDADAEQTTLGETDAAQAGDDAAATTLPAPEGALADADDSTTIAMADEANVAEQPGAGEEWGTAELEEKIEDITGDYNLGEDDLALDEGERLDNQDDPEQDKGTA